MIKHKKYHQSGFTIVEVLIATLVFSLILIGAMAALIQMGRLYQKGVVAAKTQEANRNLIAEISQSVQFSKLDIVPPGPSMPISAPLAHDVPDTGFFCIGPRRYTYAIDRQYVPGSANTSSITNPSNRNYKNKKHSLWVDLPPGGCNATVSLAAPIPNLDNDAPSSNGRDLLPENMRISKLNIVGASAGVWTIEVSLVYGDSDLLRYDGGKYECTGSLVGREYCALSELSTVVQRRL